jgi:hypothetical protein
VWIIPADDLEEAQFKSGTQVDTTMDNPVQASGQVEPISTITDSLRAELADARRRAAVAEAVATEARRELVERLADKDEIIRATRETVETQSAAITALAREVEDKDHALALVEKQIGALDAEPSGGGADVASWAAPSVATEPDENDPVPVGELRRRLADRQPPPRRWWQRIGRR